MLSVEWKQTVEYPGTWDLQKLTKSEIKQKRSNVKFNAKERTFKSPGRKCLPHFGLKAKVMAEKVLHVAQSQVREALVKLWRKFCLTIVINDCEVVWTSNLNLKESCGEWDGRWKKCEGGLKRTSTPY